MIFKIRWSGLGASMMSMTYPAWIQKHWATVGTEKVSGVIGNIASTSDGVVSHSETGASNGGIALFSTEKTESL